MSVYVSQLQISNTVPEVPLVQPRLSYCSVYFCYWFISFCLSESTLCSVSGRLLTSIFGSAIHSFILTFTPDIFINAKHKVLRFQIYLVSLYSFCIQLFATNYISCKCHFFQPFHVLQWNHMPYRNDAFSSLYPNIACQWPLTNSKSACKLLHLFWNVFFRACKLLLILLPVFCSLMFFFDIKYNYLTTFLLSFQLITFSRVVATGGYFLSVFIEF